MHLGIQKGIERFARLCGWGIIKATKKSKQFARLKAEEQTKKQALKNQRESDRVRQRERESKREKEKRKRELFAYCILFVLHPCSVHFPLFQTLRAHF